MLVDISASAAGSHIIELMVDIIEACQVRGIKPSEFRLTATEENLVRRYFSAQQNMTKLYDIPIVRQTYGK